MNRHDRRRLRAIQKKAYGLRARIDNEAEMLAKDLKAQPGQASLSRSPLDRAKEIVFKKYENKAAWITRELAKYER